jgi:GNAT superfamily N-acetyltransferase
MIRRAAARDVPALQRLMKALATFEGYADRYSVTEADLYEFGFSPGRAPSFESFVADDGDRLIGYAAFYTIPFTFDLRPTVVLKELFVDVDSRGRGIGALLFGAVLDRAREARAGLLRWQVLPNNDAAMRFYRRIGELSARQQLDFFRLAFLYRQISGEHSRAEVVGPILGRRRSHLERRAVCAARHDGRLDGLPMLRLAALLHDFGRAHALADDVAAAAEGFGQRRRKTRRKVQDPGTDERKRFHWRALAIPFE